MNEVEIILLTAILLMNLISIFRGWDFDKRLTKLEQTVNILATKIRSCK